MDTLQEGIFNDNAGMNMKIESLDISGVGGIGELHLSFSPGFNVICGPNGIGKSTILNIIADAFSSTKTMLKRNAKYEAGRYSIVYGYDKASATSHEFDVVTFEPDRSGGTVSYDERASYVMFFKDTRFINYQMLNAIPRDGRRSNFDIYRSMPMGISGEDIKGWLANRVLFGKLDNGLTNAQLANIDYALQSFSIMDPTLTFKTVDSHTLDVILSSQQGDIYFEYLSAGYKSCVYMIVGLIKEIELRFSEKGVRAEEFDGVVLIDEIDLHLHPSWQGKIVKALKTMFPQAQFIVTTHSPSVLQCLDGREIISLTFEDDGSVHVKDLDLTEYGLQGWTIEEILRDVMEMPETTSTLFEATEREFNRAMDVGDVPAIRASYEKLKAMLHPGGMLSKLIDIQVAGLVDADD